MNSHTALKVWLLQFFTGSRDPREGHSWVLISKWQPEEHRALQNHPLYGIKGWAVAFLFWLIISSAFSLWLTYSSWYSLKIMNTRAFNQLSGNYQFEMAAAWLLFGWSCMTAYWLWKKDEMFRMSYFYLALSVIILSIISGLAMGGESAAVSLLVSFFKSLISLIPIAYVFRSRRISVTCDDLLRHDDSFLMNLQEPEPKTAREKETPNSQEGKPTTIDTKSTRSTAGEKDIDRQSELVLDESDLEFYKQAFEELENNETDKGIWARAFADTGSVDEKTRALYIKLRVLQLKKHREEAEHKAEAYRKAQARRKENENQAKLEEAEENALIEKLKKYYKGPTTEINKFIKTRPSNLSKAVSWTEEENVLTCLAGGADPRLRDVHDEKPIEIAQKYLDQSLGRTPTYRSIISILTVAERLWDKGILTEQGVQNI